MSWFDNAPRKNSGVEIVETVSLSPERLSDLADYLGTQITQDKEGHYLAVPNNIDLQDPKYSTNFINYWLEESSSANYQTENERAKRIQTYKQMDTVMAEASIALDTYADEALGIGFVEDPIQITISDKAVSAQVMELFAKNDILKRARSMIRNLMKYGDLGYKINLPAARDDKTFTDIRLEYVDPLAWECVRAKEDQTVVAYQLGQYQGRKNRAQVAHGSKENRVNLWEFIQMSIYDEDFKPYGKSLLEPMRIDFDHLITMEALLAMSRAARVERLVIKVPTGANNPIQAAQKIQAIKTQFKNTIFKDTSLGTKTYARTPALTDVLVVPSDANFDISKLPTGMDLSSIEDVNYFRDRAFSVTGLPKSYFLHDEAQSRGSALQQQDVMFARKLVQFQNAYVEGLTRMVMIAAVYVTGSDLSGLTVSVKLKRPSQLSASLIEYYKTLSDTALSMVTSWMSLNKIEMAPDPMFRTLLISLGMPDTIANVFSQGGQVTPDQVQSYIMSSNSITRTNHDINRLEPYFEKLVIRSLAEKLAA
jgi:hypothetical protein